MAYSNAQILSAVINKWASPLIQSLVVANLPQLPVLAAIENKVRSTGWVSNRWSLMAELQPLLTNASGIIVEPLLTRYLQNVPDESIPQLAHSVIASAISSGNDVELLEGKIVLNQTDLKELKRLLDINLPLLSANGYKVKTTKTDIQND